MAAYRPTCMAEQILKNDPLVIEAQERQTAAFYRVAVILTVISAAVVTLAVAVMIVFTLSG